MTRTTRFRFAAWAAIGMLAAGGVLFGCSTATEQGGLTGHLDAQGNSVPGWITTAAGPSLHSQSATRDFLLSETVGCADCHGGGLSGGIARVSCLSSACHHNTPVTGWDDPSVHGASAKRAPGSSGFASCQICHGLDFSGGAAQVACSFCHGVAAPHPSKPWRGGTPSHTDTDPSNASVCARCHFPGSPNNPAAHPAQPAPAGTPPGCMNSTLCHGQVGHSVPFLDPAHTGADTGTFAANCGNCHAQAGVSPNPSAPLCSVCHTNAAVNPLVTKNCTSCHASPPDNASTAAYPNVRGAHAVHLALDSAGSPVSCTTCHLGLESGTLAHYNRANGRPGAGGRIPPGDAAFSATYDARSGAQSFDNVSLRCANVSCHGGQTTPDWRTGSIDVNTQCAACHQLADSTAGGSPQYNVYYSGRHKKHVVGEGVACTVCHSTAALAAVHFNDLSTPAMAEKRATINVTQLSFDNSANPPTCNPQAGGLSGCHNQKTWTQETLP